MQCKVQKKIFSFLDKWIWVGCVDCPRVYIIRVQSIISEEHKLGGSSFFSKYFNFNVAFRNTVEFWGKIFSLLDHWISIHCGKFSLLPGKYFSSHVNLLTNGLKISDIANKDFFELKVSKSHKQSW